MDYNSTKNQEIKGQFVGKHIYAGATQVVEFILSVADSNQEAPFNRDELDNTCYFQDKDGNEYSQDERDEQLNAWRQELQDIEDLLWSDEENSELLESGENLTDKINALEYAEPTYLEIYEWWIVSSYLAGKLKKHNQPVLEDGQNFYWGRSTTGQAILLDAVISRVCEEMLILDGQKHSWAT